MRQNLRNPVWIGSLMGGAVLLVLAVWHHSGNAPASAAYAEIIERRRQVNADERAACHGTDLEGQSDWRTPLRSGRLPAPPHDASGHTWHHPDDVLFRIVKEGTDAIVGGNYESDMPGFGDVLSDAEIRAVVDYIKSTWPERERSYQESASQANWAMPTQMLGLGGRLRLVRRSDLNFKINSLPDGDSSTSSPSTPPVAQNCAALLRVALGYSIRPPRRRNRHRLHC